MYIFETERLGFRYWAEEDAEACFLLAQDEHVGPPCGWPPHRTLEASRDTLKNILINDHTFCMIDKETGTIIGNLGIDPVHEGEGIKGAKEGDREIGYWVGYPYWNRGFMTEAVKGAIDYCFNTLKVPCLWCANIVDNPASGRVQEKNGFKETDSRTMYWPPLDKETTLVIRCLKNE